MADEEQKVENPPNESTPDPQAETRARAMGWVPKEEFRGDKTKWVDAATYAKRGEELLPIVKAENRRLQSQVQNLTTQLSQSTQATEELRQSIEDLKQFNTEVTKDRVKTNRAEIARQIKAARESGDVERELELQDQLADASRALREAEQPAKPQAKPAAAAASSSPQQNPEFVAWQEANPWFGAQGNERRTNYALAVAQDLRASRPDLVGKKEFFEKVTEEVQAVFEPQTRRGPSKVEGGNGSSRNGSGSESNEGQKTFSDLPSEAQAMARSQVKKFVGPNKSFKTEAEWFAHYVRTYRP